MADPLRTILSTGGRVVLPKAVRQRLGWVAGTRLAIEETDAGILLRTADQIPPTTIDEVFGCIAYSGPTLTIEQMDAGVMAEARRRGLD